MASPAGIGPTPPTAKVGLSLPASRVSSNIQRGIFCGGKFASFPERATSFPDPLGVGNAASLTLAVFAEFFCSVLVIFGVGTRLAAVPLLITMLVAGFIYHADDPFSSREKALLYGIGFLVLVFTGPGPWSVDAWLRPKLEAWWSRRRTPAQAG